VLIGKIAQILEAMKHRWNVRGETRVPSLDHLAVATPIRGPAQPPIPRKNLARGV